MSRQLRILIPGAVYHVTSRGNERKNIFRDEMDRNMLLKTIGEVKKKYDFKILAFVLMNNHYHFLLKTEKPNLPVIMQYMNTSYGIYFNRKYRRSGHLFQSRYHCVLVEYGPNIKEVARYMHLNPIRANAVETLPEYEWSSHAQFTGMRETGIADPEYVLRYFSDSRKKAIEEYEKYMADGSWKDKDGERIGAYGGYILGSEEFVKKIKLLIKDKSISAEIANRIRLKNVYDADEIIEAVTVYYDKTKEELIMKKGRWNRGKQILMYLLSKDAGKNNTEIAELLNGMHNSSIGRIILKVMNGIKDDKKTRQEVNEIMSLYRAKKK
jgi:REP element-mobilizing transposase RayT